jgi:hypothetical protein
MLNTNRTKKRYIKDTTKNKITQHKNIIKIKKINQKGGSLERITSDEYDRRLGVINDKTYLKTFLNHNFHNSFDNNIHIIDKKQPKNIIIKEPFINYNDLSIFQELFKSLNQEYKMINLKPLFDRNTRLLDWDPFESKEALKELYKKDLPRTQYIRKNYETYSFDYKIEGNELNLAKFKNNYNCIDCSNDFIKQINKKNSKIRTAFEIMITQTNPDLIVRILMTYESLFNINLPNSTPSSLFLIVKDCIYYILFLNKIENQDQLSSSLGYIILKYNPYNNHNLSIQTYFTNKYFDLLNSNIYKYPGNILINSHSLNSGERKELIKNNIYKIKEYILEKYKESGYNLIKMSSPNEYIYEYLSRLIGNIYFLQI